MNLIVQFQEDMKAALKSGDKTKLSVLRMLISQIKQKEIDKRTSDDKSISDTEILDILAFNVKQRREAIEQFNKGGRADLVKQETEELSILQTYMPAPLTEDEIKTMVDEIISEVNAIGMKDLGKVMKLVISKTKGRADSNIVSAIVKKTLGG